MKDQSNSISITHTLLVLVINMEAVAQWGEMTASHYIYNMYETYKHMYKTLDNYIQSTLLIANIKEISI